MYYKYSGVVENIFNNSFTPLAQSWSHVFILVRTDELWLINSSELFGIRTHFTLRFHPWSLLRHSLLVPHRSKSLKWNCSIVTLAFRR